MTSGELTHTHLQDRPSPWWQGLGKKVLHLNWSSRGAHSLQGLGLIEVRDPQEADFILAHGTEGVSLPCTGNGDAGGVEVLNDDQMQQLLRDAAKVKRRVQTNHDALSLAHSDASLAGGGDAQQHSEDGLPLILANPDLVSCSVMFGQ